MTDDTKGGEELDAESVRLRLYIAGSSPRSRKAVATVSRLAKRLGAHAEVEIVDIYEQREAAKEAQIVGVPTLDRELPPPLRRLIGDLSDERRVLLTLEIDDDPAGAREEPGERRDSS